MNNWREKNYCSVVGVAFLAEGAIMLASLIMYDLWNVWQVQFATWVFFIVGVLVIGEDILSKNRKLRFNNSYETFKDRFYEWIIAGIYVIQWAILLYGEFQSDIGEFFLVDLVTWGSITMAIIVLFDEISPTSNKKG